mmetsp:Transcript_1873/g.4798  ORF Transcript_1873/g.4798 Transcript_1873/m.4798 type:complete len:379 (-) Transcript_1873:264-1400(-)|eukprot:CAMPEP_0197495828 /NCGR_PEP_ID=MMETSP1311-20131121/38814_1 /TAXON_ID=464262 /ORGANISM="Genus nov. species nov., Strain RCC856" /LENGTH=378 /DNA_ID=CAMNT_0043041357 /DNA_START=206 /DNA_END=1342 /DNA_ORIENTATION=-
MCYGNASSLRHKTCMPSALQGGVASQKARFATASLHGGSASQGAQKKSSPARDSRRGSRALCGASRHLSSIDSSLVERKKVVGKHVGKTRAPLNRAWLHSMVHSLVTKLNNEARETSQQRGEGAVTLAFVCNDTIAAPLTEVPQQSPDDVSANPSEFDLGGLEVNGFASDFEDPFEDFEDFDDAENQGTSFDNWDVILNQLDTMEEAEAMAGLLVVKPLFGDEVQAPSCPSQPRKKRPTSASSMEKKRPVEVLPCALRGSIGDCCEEEDLDDVLLEVDSMDSYDSFYDDELDLGAAGEALDSREAVGSNDRSYGVVLQSLTKNPIVDGCYILKTSTSRSAGCQCTHYSMSKAFCGSEGECLTIKDQVNKAWLVNPFTI